jgi:SAM-dependent methyltransferase
MLDPRLHEQAAEFCKAAGAPDLLTWLSLPPTATSEQALEALKAQRKRMQTMQNNPKYASIARLLIKYYKGFEELLADPQAHLREVEERTETLNLPTLELAIKGVLADGNVSAQESAYLRELASTLGITPETLDKTLTKAAAAAGVSVAAAGATGGTDSPAGWWDHGFTRLILDAFPKGPFNLVDAYCREAHAAMCLLPHRGDVKYLGVDRNEKRLEAARSAVAAFGQRATVSFGVPTELPVQDGTADVVLSIRALSSVSDTGRAFAEALRVLKPGGRLIIVEPDGLAETFSFDGHLTDYNHAFHALCGEIDAAVAGSRTDPGRPGWALGPELPYRLRLSGFHVQSLTVWATHNLKLQPFGRLARKLRSYPRALAKATGVGEHSQLLKQVDGRVDELEAAIPADRQGWGGNVLQLYVCIAEKAH